MKVLHVSPLAFGSSPIAGGGERYAFELARAMARHADVVLLTFGASRAVRRHERLVVEQLPRGLSGRWHPLAASPIHRRLASLVRWADVVHAHQVSTLATAAAMTLGRMFGRATFATDLGGGHPYAPTAYLPILPGIDGLLLISEFSRRVWDAMPRSRRPARLEVVSGGVDPERFAPGAGPRIPGHVLFAGRVLPHKGVDYLVEAVQPPLSLTVAGRQPDERYARWLRDFAAGRPVRFLADVTDGQLAELYRSAMVTVLPSVEETRDGARTRIPELLGLVALESLACKTPVVVSSVASLPEIVEDGRTGFVVAPNDSRAIRDRLDYLATRPDRVEELGGRGHALVRERFTWEAVARRCLAAYASGRPSIERST